RERKGAGTVGAARKGEFGPHYYARRDLRVANDIKQAAIARAAANSTDRLGPYKILRKDDLDGIKFYLDAPIKNKGAEAWVLLRSSGTEPLMRIYTEASSLELVQEVLLAAVDFVHAKAPAAAH